MNFDANRKNLFQLVILRMVAIFAQIISIQFTAKFLSPDLAKNQMFVVIFILFLINIFAFFRYKLSKNISDFSLFLELLVDVASLSILIYFSGGIANPFISLFLLQVIIAAILLKTIFAYIIVFSTLVGYVILSFYFREIAIFSHSHHGNFNLHLYGMLISHIIASILLMIFITKINNNLAKQREIIKASIMAISTAHNLSTPLNTIFIAISEWKKSDFKSLNEKDFHKELLTIENQINRCKNSISEILQSCDIERLNQFSSSEIKANK